MTKRSSDAPAAGSRDDQGDNSLITNNVLPDKVNSDAGETGAGDDRQAKGDGPMPEELTGRAASTEEDLVTLMANGSQQHMTDGFRRGNGDDPGADVDTSDDQDNVNVFDENDDTGDADDIGDDENIVASADNDLD